jgi:hypothetical protein
VTQTYMAILDLQDMEMPKAPAHSSGKSNNRCGGGGGGDDAGSVLSLLLC